MTAAQTGQHFQRDIAGQRQIVRPVDFAHAAASQERHDAELAGDDVAWLPRDRLAHWSAVKQRVRLAVRVQHGLHQSEKLRITAACLFDDRPALGRRTNEHRLEDAPCAPELLRIDD